MVSLLAHGYELLREGRFYAAAAVLRDAEESPTRAQLLCACAMGMRDVQLLRRSLPLCPAGGLRDVATFVASADGAALAAGLRAAAAGARPSRPVYAAPRGVLVPAGGRRLLTQLVANLLSLRGVGCELPVTVAHANELAPRQVSYLRHTFAVDVLDVCAAMPEGTEWRGFQIKLAALAASPYRTTILADADVLWLASPTQLADAAEAHPSRTVLFSDFWRFDGKQHARTGSTAWLYEHCGVAPTGHEVESGVVAWASADAGVRAALRHVALHYREFFGWCFGDKDLYRLVLRVARQPEPLRTPPPQLLLFRDDGAAAYVGHSMLQRGPGGALSHVHSTLHPVEPALVQPTPVPTHVSDAADVEFVADADGRETVGAAAPTALAADALASHVLRRAAADVAQHLRTMPWS